MGKRLLFLLFLCLALVFASNVRAKELPKAKTMAELAARYDSSSCKECHEEIYEQWENSLHARSLFGTGRTAPTIITSIEKGLKRWPYSGVKDIKDIKVKHLMICAKCHLPQLDEATDDVAREIVETLYTWKKAVKEGNDDLADEMEEKLNSLNIGCLVCHQKKAIIHPWVDGPVDKKAVYGNSEYEHEFDKFPMVKKAPALGESIFCGQCHGLGPNFELEHPSQCATLYGSYLYAYIPEGGHESCQDCHMKKSGLGHDMQAYRDENMVKMALDVDVDAMAYFWRKNKAEGVIPQAVVTVEILNKAGHVIPDG